MPTIPRPKPTAVFRFMFFDLHDAATFQVRLPRCHGVAQCRKKLSLWKAPPLAALRSLARPSDAKPQAGPAMSPSVTQRPIVFRCTLCDNPLHEPSTHCPVPALRVGACEHYLRLCNQCGAVRGVRILYKKSRRWTPAWDVHIQRLVRRAKAKLPLFPTNAEKLLEKCHEEASKVRSA